jgi:3-oxoacyl-[acyl-carrier-protein] synthase II
VTVLAAPADARPADARRDAATVVAAVRAWSLHLPDADPDPPGLPAALRGLVGAACQALQAASILGRKGLLAKEPATRLALCAVHTALAHPPGARPTGVRQPRTAVVGCGNLGNVETVVDLARTVRAGSVRDVSPLAAPNASSNVLASTVALWFGLAGPNLMVCSGATAGLDGLEIAVRLLRADRADRVVLVGAEPDDEVAGALRAGLRAGAACVVLERGGGPGRSVFVSPSAGPPEPAGLAIGPHGLDPAAVWGDTYGAQGVVSLALAAAAVASGRIDSATVSCGDADDGWRRARVWAAAEGGPS